MLKIVIAASTLAILSFVSDPAEASSYSACSQSGGVFIHNSFVNSGAGFRPVTSIGGGMFQKVGDIFLYIYHYQGHTYSNLLGVKKVGAEIVVVNHVEAKAAADGLRGVRIRNFSWRRC